MIPLCTELVDAESFWWPVRMPLEAVPRKLKPRRFA